MIFIITNYAERLCELVRDKDMGISKTVIGNGDCLMINHLGSGKSPKEFKRIFTDLGLEETEPSEENLKIRNQVRQLEYDVIPDYIDLRKDFDETNIHLVANLIEQLFDGYLVENNMKLLKAAFEAYLKAGN